MRIWLVQTGEEMPIDGPETRLLRTALLANELVARGHDVVYWNATFNHQRKIQRFTKTTMVRQNDQYDCVFLYGHAYKKNVSIARIRSQRENASAFCKYAPTMPQPDVILCGFPTIELANAVAEFAVENCIPLIMDARDMWPDVIETHLNTLLKLAAFPILAFWRTRRQAAFAAATSIVGISTSFVAWGAACAKRAVRETDQAFHLAGNMQAPDLRSMAAARAYWDDILGLAQTAKPVLLMAGNLSARVDIMTAVNSVVQAANHGDAPYTLVVCGKGDLESEIKTISEQCVAVVYAGWRSAAEIKALSERAVGGVLAYSNTADLMAGFPNKIGEYLSFGLPIITCLKGETERLLGNEGVIIPYVEGDTASAAAAFQSAVDAGAEMRKKAQDCFLRYFDSNKIYTAFADHFEHIGSIKPPTRVNIHAR
jgi:glycosyltransferase involved in cell wall biosynthesis